MLFRSALLLVAILLSSLYIVNNRFSLNYHTDETKKVHFVQTGKQDYHHPLLLLQSTRLAVAITDLFTDTESKTMVVFIGRCVSAFFALLAWLFSYLLFSKIMSRWEALAVSTIAAFTPIIAVHAHYLKEDTFLLAGIYASLWALVSALESHQRKYWLFLAIALGFSFSSHYKSSMLVPIMFIAPLLKEHRLNKAVYLNMVKALAGSAIVALIINYPIFTEMDTLLKGIEHEKGEALDGHDIIMPFSRYWFTFHLQESIVPGITLFLTIPGLLGGLFYLTKTPQTKYWKQSTLVLTVVILYAVVEASQKKPAPDYMRYVIPIIPAYLALGYLFVKWVYEKLRPQQATSLAIATVVLLSIYPLYDSIKLVQYLDDDTRAQVAEVIDPLASREEVVYEYYASGDNGADDWMFTYFNWKKAVEQGKRYAVASSFAYDRFFNASVHEGQTEWAIRSKQVYSELFEKLPYIEIKPKYKSFAFSNPTLRIVDLEHIERLSFVDLDSTTQ